MVKPAAKNQIKGAERVETGHPYICHGRAMLTSPQTPNRWIACHEPCYRQAGRIFDFSEIMELLSRRRACVDGPFGARGFGKEI
jgi:hypothetical protein